MQLEYQGLIYDVPDVEPPQDRRSEVLHPLFRVQLDQYIIFAQRFTPYEIRMGETLRTLERQVWLFSQGRLNKNRVLSWTLDSKHRWGLACDLILVDRGADLTITVDDTAVWAEAIWRKLYADAPPSWFGLTPISKELVHLEHASAAQIVDRSLELGLAQV